MLDAFEEVKSFTWDVETPIMQSAGKSYREACGADRLLLDRNAVSSLPDSGRSGALLDGNTASAVEAPLSGKLEAGLTLR